MKDIELPPLPERIREFADGSDIEAIEEYARECARAAVEANSVPNGDISGALFDFAGFLTTLNVPVRFGSTEEASPMVELLQEFAKKRGLSLENANVLDWSAMLSASPSPAQQERKPMTDDGWITVFREASRAFFSPGCRNLDEQVNACAHAAMRATERHHGIKE